MQPAKNLTDEQHRQLSAERRRLFERCDVVEHVGTHEGALLLGKQPQTLRRWACEGSGPLRPHRVNGRLMWSLADIRAILKGSGAAT